MTAVAVVAASVVVGWLASVAIAALRLPKVESISVGIVVGAAAAVLFIDEARRRWA